MAEPLRLILPDDSNRKPRLTLAELAAAARGAAGVPGCRNCGGKLTKKVLGEVRCAHCGVRRG